MSFTPPIIFAVSTLVLSSLSLEFTSHPKQEIITECVAWCLILLLGKLYFHYVSKTTRPFNAAQLGPIAFGVTLLCLSSSVQDTIWSTAPLLGPALILIERGTASLPEHKEAENEDLADWAWKGAAKKRTIFLCSYTVLTLLALSQDDTVISFRLKLCWLFAQILLCWGLFQRVSQSNGFKSESFAEALHTATELASYMVFITVPLVILWSKSVPSIPHVGVVGFLKASRWVSILLLAHESKLSLTAWATIFAVCTNALWVYPHGWQTALILAGALVAVYRVSTTFPQSSLAKWTIVAFAVFPVWAFGIHSNLTSHMAPAWPAIPSAGTVSKPWSSAHHPIYHLAEEARVKFEQTDAKQSRSYADAVTEYKKRYGRLPPPGFNDWYNFAIENDVQWIDEYDYLTKSLEPFWQMPPKTLRDYVDQALHTGGVNLNTLEIKDHEASLKVGSFQHAQLVQLLEPVVQFLPDLKAALNEFDEPRVLVPYDMLHSNSKTPHQPKSQDVEAQQLYFGAQDKQRIWESVTLSCAPDSEARSPFTPAKKEELFPPFITNLAESQDICLWPSSESKKHGFLASPSTFHYTHHLAPVMSTARISSFHDIMMPSSYYFQGDIASYDEKKDSDWEDKKDIVYWRGSGTGGHWTDGSWKMGHRQRFVTFANNEDEEIKLMRESTPGKWEAYKTTMSDVIDKFLVKFSNFIQCDESDCNAQEEFFHKVEADSNSDASSYKILYNLDGNSFSGRYYRFLKSNSLVFMQALFKEWHDDRLVPWLHFVPIGLSMEELPETTRYLLEDPEGKVIAARMASESREWTRRILRPVDLSAAYLRVFLEYARLLDDNRDSLS